MKRLPFGLSVLLTLVACGGQVILAPPAPSAAGPGVPLTELIAAVMGQSSTSDTAKLLARLEPPLKTDSERVPNTYIPGQIDTRRTLYYDGLSLSLYNVSNGDTFVTDLRVTGSEYVVDGLHTGMTRAEVAARLGRPDDTALDSFTYYPDPLVPDTVQLVFAGQLLAELRWIPYWE